MSQTAVTLLVLAIMAGFFLSQRIPHYVTGMTGALALAFLGIIPAKALFTGFSNPTLILFAGMFVIGGAMFQTGLADAVGEWAVRKMGRNERLLLWGTMIAAALLSTVASNTGTTAALMPVVLGIALSAGIPASRLLMPLAFATGFGGFSALIGTPPNMIASQALADAGSRPFGFFEFAWVGLPVALAGMLYFDLIGRRMLPITCTSPVHHSHPAPKERKAWKMWTCALILIAVIVVMTLDLPGVSLEAAAVTGAVLCVLTGCIKGGEALESIEWETIVLFGSMFAVAHAMEASGAAERIAGSLLRILGDNAHPAWIIGLPLAFTMLLGTVLSNTACALLMAPIGLFLARETGANPHAILMAIALAASCSFLTPVGTPPNLIVWEAGGYRFMDYFKVGAGLSLVCLLVGVVIIPWKWPLFAAAGIWFR
jgi:anion transporter